MAFLIVRLRHVSLSLFLLLMSILKTICENVICGRCNPPREAEVHTFCRYYFTGAPRLGTCACAPARAMGTSCPI